MDVFAALTVVVAVISAFISIVSVVDARRSRRQAIDSAEDAKSQANNAIQAARDSAAASQRMADALELANNRAAETDAASIPWTVSKESAERWRLTNATGGRAQYVRLFPQDGVQIQAEDGKESRDIERGGPVFVFFGGGMTDPTTAEILVTWSDAAGSAKSFTVTLA
ncbi:hypothetical protein [Glaciihabitans sp. dw_435]|uniref:hypothetical protein n=1 Tax=Glaciihabitans sp. dw_435 TaxID=2720081 RepID=UPI001BD31731|nr:hypothetical protein [Glaciihabitans sp. dw_435]